MRAAWLVCAFVLAVAGCRDARPARDEDARGSATGLRFLGGAQTEGFARALAPRALDFPADHGPHPEFRTEWWYFTGNLRSTAGQRYGFELTFFRVGLGGETSQRASAWASTEAWMAHFTVTDAVGRRFFAAQRLARGALGLAGAAADPFRVFVKDWSAEGTADSERTSLRLRARDGATAIDLVLETTEPPVLHGERGLDAKGPEPGNASYYYSLPRLATTGSVSLGGNTSDVSGFAWMDREWSTSALSDGVSGWDWFGLRLSDGRSLMFYRLRRTDGGTSPFSGGSLVGTDGTRTRLASTDVDLTASAWWESPETLVRYPVAWRLEVPAADISLQLEPYAENQEVNLSVRYWEGAVEGSGRAGNEAVKAEGYLELAGY